MVGPCSKVFLILSLVCCCACEFVLGACNVTYCTDLQKCVLSIDKRNCKCAVGYYGDLCDRVATINILCAKDYISIMVIEDFFSYNNVKMDTLHLRNEACKAHREVISSVSYYVVRTYNDQFSHCGGKATQNSTHVTYSQTLTSDSKVDGGIRREPAVNIEYRCVYPYIRSVSLPFPITPFASETVMRMNEMEATVVMRVYKDETYREAYSSSPLLHLQDKVYIEARVTEPEDFFHLMVQECWVTHSPNPSLTEGFSHLLLSGCVKDKTVRFLNDSVRSEGGNGHGSVFRFSFDMFHFVLPPRELYLHCAVQLCVPEDGGSCIPECKSKRDILKEVSEQGLLSYGPIRLDTSDKPKYRLLLKLVLPVSGIWVLGSLLFILVAIAKGSSRQMSNLLNR